MTMTQYVSSHRARKSALPSLFGRLTAVWLDHGELTALLPRIEEMCRLLDAGCTVPPPSLHPARLIEEFEARLQRHFEAEETSGYFSTIARQRPEFLPTIVALKADHVTMLEELRELERAAGDYTQWTRLSRRARGLMSFLRQHEATEADLMHGFLSTDDNVVVHLHA
jgi:hypothetical protein